MKNRKILKTICLSLLLTTMSHSIGHAQYSDYISDETIKGKNLIIASSKSYADSISSINLLKKGNRRLILIDDKTDIPSLMEKTKAKDVTIIGGKSQVNEETEQILQSYANVNRIAGKNRIETNRLTLTKKRKKIVVNKNNFQDAISAVNLIKERDMDVYLLDKEGEKIENAAFTVGGSSVIKNGYGIRIAGKDRFETNQNTLKYVNKKNSQIYSSADDFIEPLTLTNKLMDNTDSVIVFKRSPKVIRKNVNELKKFIEDKEDTVTIDGKKLPLIRDEKDANRFMKNHLFKNHETEREVAISVYNTDYIAYLQTPQLRSLGLRFEVDDKGVKEDDMGYKYRLAKLYLRAMKENVMSDKRVITKDRMIRNENYIRYMIKQSGALMQRSEKKKADAFAKYMMSHYPYYEKGGENRYDFNTEVQTISRHPFTITENKTAVCEGYVLAFNEAMRQLNIPVYSKTVLNRTHIISVAKVDGKWLPYDVTGYVGTMPQAWEITEQDLRGDYVTNTVWDDEKQKEEMKRIEDIK